MREFIQANSTTLIAITSIAVAALVLVNIYLLAKIIRVNRKSRQFFSGKKGEDLESIINGQSREIKELDKEVQELFEISNKIHSLAFKSIHKVGVIRFNPFKDIGGDQSFAIALLDGKNSGVVISSLHTREGTRVYTKPVMKGESKKYPLSEEEKQAIKIASPIKEGKV